MRCCWGEDNYEIDIIECIHRYDIKYTEKWITAI